MCTGDKGKDRAFRDYVYNRQLVGTCYKAQGAQLGALW